MSISTTAASPQHLARLSGALYLVIFIGAGFAQGYVRGTLIAPGDAAATAANIAAAEGVFRWGLAADLTAFLADLAVAVLLYVLLRPAGRVLALTAAAFRVVAHPAIAAVNLVNHAAVLPLLDGQGAGAWDEAARQALVLHHLEMHGWGYLIAGAFFGVHCALLAALILRSGFLPRFLGVLLALAAAAYLAECFGAIVAPGHEGALALLVGITAATGEGLLALWLLIKGVDAARWRALAAGARP